MTERQRYSFTEKDKPLQRPFGNEEWVPAYGFWFSGDDKRPRGLYSNDGTFYGNNGAFSEFDLMLAELMRTRMKIHENAIRMLEFVPVALGGETLNSIGDLITSSSRETTRQLEDLARSMGVRANAETR
jgi:hypothetical protein